jgi:hypothetical protein
MTVFFLESVSKLILFGLLPLFVTVAIVWILWRVLEKTDADEVIDIRSFVTFIVVVIPFVILVYGGLTYRPSAVGLVALAQTEAQANGASTKGGHSTTSRLA